MHHLHPQFTHRSLVTIGLALFAVIVASILISLCNQSVLAVGAPDSPIVFQFESPGSRVKGLAWDGNRLWLVDNLKNVYAVDTQGKIIKQFTIDFEPTCMSWDGSSLWIGNYPDRRIERLNTDGNRSGSLNIMYWANSGFAWARGFIWVVDYNFSIFHKHDSSGRELFNWEVPDGSGIEHPTCVAFDGNDLWTGDPREGFENNIARITEDGVLLNKFDLNAWGILSPTWPELKSLAFDGQYMWYASDQHRTIYRFDLIPLPGSATPTPTLLPPTPTPTPPVSTDTLLSLYILAFDNPISSPTSLAPFYQPIVDSLIGATVNNPKKTAVVLADLGGDHNTRIFVIQNGLVTSEAGLPDANGTLQPSLDEYDTADGTMLGGFIRWARAQHSASRTTLSYIGHGLALAPDTDITRIFSNTRAVASRASPWLPPLPTRIDASPDLTDHLSQSVVTPYQLAQALKAGTDNGQTPLDVLDLVHCFAATIEEFYEVSPFAKTLVGSPNYTYLDPAMIGNALAAMSSSDSEETLAQKLVTAYDNTLPVANHPRLMVAVRSDFIRQIKAAWDDVALLLLQSLTISETGTKNNLVTATLGSAKYDTTYCPPDWNLDAPDALVDLADFADKLGAVFGHGSEIGLRAGIVRTRVLDAIIVKRARDGMPWFAGQFVPDWNWDKAQGVAHGIAIYADLNPKKIDGKSQLLWQMRWYTETISADNPHPYAFVLEAASSGATWADVLQRFWQGESIETVACLPEIPPGVQPGELSLGEIFSPRDGIPVVGSPITLSAVIQTADIAYPLLGFTISQNGTPVFSTTVGARYLITGAHRIDATTTWTPMQPGKITVAAFVDPNGRYEEANEGDNAITKTLDVFSNASRHPLPVISVAQSQWTSSRSISLQFTQTPDTAIAPVRSLLIEVYQFRSTINPRIQVSSRLVEIKLDPVNLQTQPIIELALPASVQPGPVILHILPTSSSGISPFPFVVAFNYAPSDVAIGQNDLHYYIVNARRGDNVRINLDVSPGMDASLLVWDPMNFWVPNRVENKIGDDAISFAAQLDGEYLIGVQGETPGTRYILNAQILQSGTSQIAMLPTPDAHTQFVVTIALPKTRPQFLTPATRTGRKVFLPMVIKP